MPRAVTADRGYGEPARRTRPARTGRPHRGDPAQGHDPARPARPSSTAAASAGTSSGAPAARAGSATSNAATAGTAPAWTARREPRSGAGTGSSPTTWSRSAPWPPNQQGQKPPGELTQLATRSRASRRGLFQVEVARRSGPLYTTPSDRSGLSARRSRIGLTHRQAHKIGNFGAKRTTIGVSRVVTVRACVARLDASRELCQIAGSSDRYRCDLSLCQDRFDRHLTVVPGVACAA